jgi:hypothetical protein
VFCARNIHDPRRIALEQRWHARADEDCESGDIDVESLVPARLEGLVAIESTTTEGHTGIVDQDLFGQC